MKVKGNYINGQWVAASSGKEKSVINPTNGQTITTIVDSTKNDVREAIAAARKSFYETRAWRDMCPQERADMMLRIADAIEERKQDIAVLDSINNGKPLRESECDVDDAIHCFRYYAGLITKPSGTVYNVNKGFGDRKSVV